MSYTITTLKPVYCEHGAGVDEQGRAFDMVDVREVRAASAADLPAILVVEVSRRFKEDDHPHAEWAPFDDPSSLIGVDGGTVGPLPSGHVIEVRRDRVTSDDGVDVDYTTEAVAALADVLHVTSLRGKPASHDVQVKAAALLGRPIRGLRTEPARVYPIEGDGGLHLVALYLETKWRKGWDAHIVAAECSCDYHGELVEPGARSDRGACSHLLAALARARLQGLTIKEEDA